MTLMVALNRGFGVLQRLFVLVVAIAILTIFAPMPLAAFIKSPGPSGLQHLIHSDGFFPWPVATIFFLGGYAPALIFVGVIGAIIGGVLRSMLFKQSSQLKGEVVAVRQTGTTVNSRPQMRLTIRTGARQVEVKALIALGAIPRPGDQVRLLVSRVDPSLIKYAGLIGPSAPSGAPHT